jgi:hypothetical protein
MCLYSSISSSYLCTLCGGLDQRCCGPTGSGGTGATSLACQYSFSLGAYTCQATPDAGARD